MNVISNLVRLNINGNKQVAAAALMVGGRQF